MKDRIDYALAPSSITNNLIEIIATWSNGAARVALQTIRAAAMSAEAKKEATTIDDVKDAFRSARKSKLNEYQKFLLEAIEKENEIDSGELFRIYQSSFEQPLGRTCRTL